MPRVNPITIPVPSDGDSAAAYSLRMMGSHFGGAIGAGRTVTGRWFEVDKFTSFEDAMAGGLCERSGLYFPGHRMKSTRHGERHGDIFHREDPEIDEWSDEPWQH